MPVTPGSGVTGVQPPALVTALEAGSESQAREPLQPLNKRPRLDDDPLSRYPGYKHYRDTRCGSYCRFLEDVVDELTEKVQQYLLLASAEQLRDAGVKIVMGARNTSARYLVWPGMSVPPERLDWRTSDAVHAMMADKNFKQVLEGVRGVQLLTPEQAQQFTAKEKDRKETVAVLDKAASVMHELELAKQLTTAAAGNQAVNWNSCYNSQLSNFTWTADNHSKSLKTAHSAGSAMASERQPAADIRQYLEKKTAAATDWLSGPQHKLLIESLRVLQHQEALLKLEAKQESEQQQKTVASLQEQVSQLQQQLTETSSRQADIVRQLEIERENHAATKQSLVQYQQKYRHKEQRHKEAWQHLLSLDHSQQQHFMQKMRQNLQQLQQQESQQQKLLHQDQHGHQQLGGTIV